MVVGVVMTPHHQEQHPAERHADRQDRLAPLLDKALHTCGLRSHEERNTEQNIGSEFAQDKHGAVGQYFLLVAYLTVDITDGGNAREKRTGIEYGEQP